MAWRTRRLDSRTVQLWWRAPAISGIRRARASTDLGEEFTAVDDVLLDLSPLGIGEAAATDGQHAASSGVSSVRRRPR
jgi:hypothetical protein